MKLFYWIGAHFCFMVGNLVSKADQTKWFCEETDAFQDRWYRIYSWWMCKSFDLDEKIGFKIWKVPAKEDINIIDEV
jgi:hypothetical protein